ncbi:MAG: hypothetical protein IPP49_01405 [Saprospiraceae bacterium]|nr:hypothetical protein [Saprospiraceae bacterium]
MYIRKLFILFAFTLSISAAYTQASPDLDKIKALNNYVNFSNESTHGLLIVHRLLENFNKNINKYVDLPDQQINFYSNKDLPQDIFEDAENWFYDTSPNEWFGKIGSYSGILPAATESRLKATATEMKTIITAVNKIRFDLEEQIKTLDLSKRENLSLVYDKLEEGVKLYKSFYTKQLVLEADIDAYYKTLKFSKDEMQFPEVLGTLKSVYTTTRSALTALYNKEDDNFGDLIKAQQTALNNFSVINLADYNSTRLINSRIQMYWGNIKRQADESIKSEKAFLESENLQEEYKLYDKYYYYYNISVINKFNRYGNGVVFEINRIIDYLGVPVLRYFEMPHYFKVIYPKLLEKTEYLAASDPVVKALPKVVKGRNVVTATRVIKVDSFLVDFTMYDHKIIDRDVVSLSYNGDWIVEKFEISQKPYEFTIKLNAEGKNFLLLHADDMGRQPPATIALSYKYKGKKEVIILNSDTVKSEVIEIVVGQ